MKKLDLVSVEIELTKRLEYPYKWLRKQNDAWDNATKFIYKTADWLTFRKELEGIIAKSSFNKNHFSYYAMNRWYNFWSAQAAEQIFTDLPGFAPNPNPVRDKYDFRWLGERFDLKTSVFPKGYGENYAFAKAQPKHLIQWFYKQQSTGQRYHHKNRLFLVCYDPNGHHYKLKAKVGLLKRAIHDYVKADRTPADTYTLQLQDGEETLADIIWVTP